jgi:hypothetical protein
MEKGNFWLETLTDVTSYFTNRTNAQAGVQVATANANAITGVVKSIAIIGVVGLAGFALLKSLFKK